MCSENVFQILKITPLCTQVGRIKAFDDLLLMYGKELNDAENLVKMNVMNIHEVFNLISVTLILSKDLYSVEYLPIKKA